MCWQHYHLLVVVEIMVSECQEEETVEPKTSFALGA